MNFWNDKKVLVTGGFGFVGHSVVEHLKVKKCKEMICPTHEEYDLMTETQVDALFNLTRPDVVIHLAGKVGGIGANKSAPGAFFYENIMMGTLVMEYAQRYKVKKAVGLAAGCGYPKYLDVPYKESDFWMGLPDENSIGYSMAKKMMIIQSWTYRQQYGFDSTILLPANLYGPWDNFDLDTSHVVPALIRKFVEAEIEGADKVVVWGSGKASREFLFVEDAARVILDAAEKISESGPFNLGTGVETSIKKLVNILTKITCFKGDIVWDKTKPDGQPRRYYNMSLLRNKLGYVPNTPLREGLKKTIEWYRNNCDVMFNNKEKI